MARGKAGSADIKSQALLDALALPIVVIDGDGEIVNSNKLWNAKSARHRNRAACEQNYFTICASVLGLHERDLPLLQLGLQSVAQTDGDDFVMEVPFQNGPREGLYRIRGTQLSGTEPWVLVSHLDVSDRRQVETKLESTEGRLSAQAQVLEHIKDALVVTDMEGLIKSWNPGAERLYGYSATEVIGRSIRLVYPDGDIPVFRPDTWNVLREVGHCELETVKRHKSGRMFHAQTSLSVLRDSKGQPEGLISYTMDVTDRKRIAQELEASMHQLEEALSTANELSIEAKAASEAKSEFLANVSHEIRTPLNGVIGMTELLVGTELNAEQQEYAKTIQTSAAALLSVLNDVLDFSKIEAGKMSLEANPFNLREVVETAADLFAPQAQTKGLELILSIPPETPTSLLGDALRIRQIITNLIGNAIKFTESGEIVAGVTTVENYGGEARLRLWVKDTGPGIPEHRHAAIFDSFTQGDSSTTRKHGGTGLGLAICKNLCKLMGGEVGLESVVGEGSTFYFDMTLPKQFEDEALPVFSACEGKFFLIMDRNATTRRVVRNMLEFWGARCDEAVCVEDVMRDSVPGPYDLILASDSGEAKLFTWSRVVGMYPVGVKPSSSAPYAGVLQKPIKMSHLRRILSQLFSAPREQYSGKTGQPAA
jgi:PAS domain S-box-containing protein